ncbi:carboxymuconolactone decarboxylase family protein [Noviherbaspirillum sp. CPCC 100848]|uniref:Carboxymuconolactone decarboxylase family protein n=1 Tax=Noviherbaspirillum album TaxID=3080276 RepID=A0ABU6J4Y2_9BURK|nr:carboxymuconolactone decarboxylase family protein [Noviherbaspirillum sp. CPCC 100848]MEC4718491.1 carboxymuconolactone decarboxylase family protein [Noviherbaspirillum sp. CPCC 100848]
MTNAKPTSLQDCMPGPERMPALPMEQMDAAQRAAAEALIAGPRGAVFGPFIPLMRSPELLNRLQKVGEYLRFDSVLDKRISEFVMLIVSRQWTQQFEWCMHYPLALKAGVRQEALDALAEGRRPTGMAADEEAAYELCEELARNHGVSDATYARAVETFGERGVVDLIGLAGYFTTVSMLMNVARTPPLADAAAAPLASFPR